MLSAPMSILRSAKSPCAAGLTYSGQGQQKLTFYLLQKADVERGQGKPL
jgi:hypothetical protein